MGESDNLGAGLVELADLVAESVSLEETMLRLAGYAAELIPAAAGATLATLENDARRACVATSARVQAADEAQYETGEGPCIAAIERRDLVVSASLAGEPAWPRYGGRARRLGLQSALAAPLVLRDNVIGVLTLYARSKNAFTEREVRMARRFSAPATAVVRNAEVLTQSRSEIAHLRKALDVRPVIDQAIGIIRSRTGDSEDAAFERLRAISSTEHVKISDVAVHIVDDAVRRARHGRQTP